MIQWNRYNIAAEPEGTFRHFSLIPSGGEGILAHSLGHIASWLKFKEVDQANGGIESVIRKVDNFLVDGKLAEAAAELEAEIASSGLYRCRHLHFLCIPDFRGPKGIWTLQDVFNLLPNLNVNELVKAFSLKTKDMMLVIYLSSLIRSVIALHNLINNKLLNKEHEKAVDSKSVAVLSGR